MIEEGVRVGCRSRVETHGRASLRWDALKTDDFPINFYRKNLYLYNQQLNT